MRSLPAGRERGPVIGRGELKALGGGAGASQLLRRIRRHAQNRKWMRRRRARVQKLEQFGLFVLDPAPVADPAPLVMKPDANSEKARIELHRRAVGRRSPRQAGRGDSRAAPRLACASAIVGRKRDRLAIGFDRLFEGLLALQRIAEIDIDLGEIRPQRERAPVSFDRWPGLLHFFQDIAEAEIGFGRVGPLRDDLFADSDSLLLAAEFAQDIGGVGVGGDEAGIERRRPPVGL